MSTELARIEYKKARPLIEVEETPIVSVDPLRVVYEFWRVTQSQYHYKGLGEIDLGPLDEDI
jgi:hypothetical protein